MENNSHSGLLRWAMFLLQAVTAGLALAFVLTRLMPTQFAAPVSPPVPTPAEPVSAVSPSSYRRAVDAAGPAVVSIYTQRVVTAPTRVFGDPLLQRYGGISMAPARRLERSLGSGVIMRADGYVLTNFHVIAGADDIWVGFSDERVTSAKLIGADRETDLAVLKIDGSQLPVVRIAVASRIAVGDVVLAIGNPYGFSQTVTLGIVSATGRNQLSLSRYEDFIQTDAAINSGNSGGALVNAQGELLGINTAQFGQGLGISFAIPAEAATRVLAEIIDHGEVIRGWIGAEYADTPANMLTDNAPRGAMIALTMPGGPADLAGLQPGDIIRIYHGAEINDQNDIRGIEAGLKPGSEVKIAGARAGVPFEVTAVIGKRPNVSTRASPSG